MSVSIPRYEQLLPRALSPLSHPHDPAPGMMKGLVWVIAVLPRGSMAASPSRQDALGRPNFTSLYIYVVEPSE